MGRGSYTSADWTRLKKSASITTEASVSQIFKRRSMDDKFNPVFIEKRESRDSDDHPDSTPIIIGLDVTGSMGYLSENIAKNSLNEVMMKLYSTNMVKDPQILFAAVGDVKDNAPLQVTQFESDIRIAEQLLELWLEFGGKDAPEDYELLWYFAARHTMADAFEKGRKGFLFTIGDADIHSKLDGGDVTRIFGDSRECFSSRELYNMASKNYEIFHIQIIKESSVKMTEFTKIMPGRIVPVDKANINRLPEIIISIMQIANGEDKERVLEQWDELAKPIVNNALSKLVIRNQKKREFFF